MKRIYWNLMVWVMAGAMLFSLAWYAKDRSVLWPMVATFCVAWMLTKSK
jgi:hypothetical protein